MTNILIRSQQRYQFNYLDKNNKPAYLRNAFGSTLSVIWYKDDQTGIELWIPFGTDRQVPATQLETHYTVPRIFTYTDKVFHLGGCLCFEPDTLIQQQMAHDSTNGDRSQWFVRTPLTRSDCLYGDQDDFYADVATIAEYQEQGYYA